MCTYICICRKHGFIRTFRISRDYVGAYRDVWGRRFRVRGIHMIKISAFVECYAGFRG